MNPSQSQLPPSGGLQPAAYLSGGRARDLWLARAISAIVQPTRARRETAARAATGAKQICLFGLFGGGNYGNDGSLEAMLLVLREVVPGAEIACVCVDPDQVERMHHIPGVAVSWQGFPDAASRLCDRLALRIPGRMLNWVRAIRYLRRFDMLVVAGTATLCDYRSGPFGTPYGLFRWAIAARLCGVKLCFVGTGAGPVTHPVSRWMLTSVARSAYYMSFRDQVSKDFVTSLGVDTRHDPVFPDIVFRLPTPVFPAGTAPQGRPVTIGVGVMSYYGWQQKVDQTIYETYLSKISDFVGSLLERGFRVRLLVGQNSDQVTVEDVGDILAKRGHHLSDPAPAVPAPGQLITEPTNSLHDIMCQIADTDIVVATRFHNVICALKLGRPTISISYEAKNDAVLADFGLGTFCQHIEHFDVERLNDQAMELLNQRAFYEDMIRHRLEDIQVRMRQHEEALVASVF